MNAYELADELDSMLRGAGLNNNRVPTMLRQQADRIAELEKTLAILEGEYPEPTINAKIKEFNDLQEAYETGKRDALK